jgi:hypothetical protein
MICEKVSAERWARFIIKGANVGVCQRVYPASRTGNADVQYFQEDAAAR